MQSTLSYFLAFVTRWSRAIVLCMIICGGITFVITTLMPRVYTAETTLIITHGGSPQSEGGTESALTISVAISQLIKNDTILEPVAVRHGLTIAQLKDMVTAKPQSNMPIILIDVNNSDAVSATHLSYEVTRSFVDYAMNQIGTPAQFNILKPTVPQEPSMPRPTQSALLGTLAGLVLAMAAITTSEWINNRFPKRI